MVYMSKVLKIVGITLVISSSACAAPSFIKGGDKWPSLNYSQDENKLPTIKPIPKPVIGNSEGLEAKPNAAVTVEIKKMTKQKAQWQATMGAQKSIYKNAKEKLLLAKPDNNRNAWMTAQLQLSRLSQVGDDLALLVNEVDALSEKEKDPALDAFRATLIKQRDILLAFLAKELAFLEKMDPNI
jgi:hypothetical protein